MYRLSNNIEIYSKDNEKKIHVLKRGLGVEQVIECDQRAIKFIKNLKNNHGTIRVEEGSKYPDLIEFMLSNGIITKDKIPDRSHPYRTQLQTFCEWGVDPFVSQHKVEGATVAIIGCGGSGGWLSLELASMGVSKIKLIDPDRVENSNIMRQPFDHTQLNQKKTIALKTNLLKKNQRLIVETDDSFIQADSNLDSLLSSYDYICIAADFPSISEMGKLIGDWCLKNNRTHFICGGYSGHHSALGLSIIPNVTLCWNCYLKWYKTQISKETVHEPMMTGPVNPSGIIPVVMMAASMTAMDIIRVIIGLPPILSNARFDLIPFKLLFKKSTFNKNQNCKYCKDIN